MVAVVGPLLPSATRCLLAAGGMLQQHCPCSASPTTWPLQLKREVKLENATYTLFLLFSQQALAWGSGERTGEIKELYNTQ